MLALNKQAGKLSGMRARLSEGCQIKDEDFTGRESTAHIKARTRSRLGAVYHRERRERNYSKCRQRVRALTHRRPSSAVLVIEL